MKAQVDAGADLDLRDQGPNGWTPIMHALHKGQAKAALALLEWGADRAAAPDLRVNDDFIGFLARATARLRCHSDVLAVLRN